jgi:hypothetical protein
MPKEVKRTLQEQIKDDVNIMYQDLEEVISNLQYVLEKHRTKYFYIEIVERGYDDSWFEFWGTREETDEEFNKRVSKETSTAAKQKTHDLAVYEHIKKKYKLGD